jgi:hypothetical protein
MCDLIGKLQSADNLRSSAGLSTCYRPYAEFLEQFDSATEQFRSFGERQLVAFSNPPGHVGSTTLKSIIQRSSEPMAMIWVSDSTRDPGVRRPGMTSTCAFLVLRLGPSRAPTKRELQRH